MRYLSTFAQAIFDSQCILLNHLMVKDFTWWVKILQCLNEATNRQYGLLKTPSKVTRVTHHLSASHSAQFGLCHPHSIKIATGFWSKILFCTPLFLPFTLAALYTVSIQVHSLPMISIKHCSTLHRSTPRTLQSLHHHLSSFNINISYCHKQLFHMTSIWCTASYYAKNVLDSEHMKLF
jgi:hypothetical protein